MSDVDLWFLEPPGPAEENPYIELGWVLSSEIIDESIERELDGLDIEYCEPLERVVRLMKAGDQHVLLDSDPNEAWLYGLALDSVLDPHVQLELGCLLLQRADPDESPLCEHIYAEEGYDDWDPHTEIHDEVGPGPPSRQRQETIRLALRAYGNAWSYYKWGYVVSPHCLFRSLLALDGMRVCYSQLEDHESMWKLCSGLKPWLRTVRHEFGVRGGEVDKFVAEIQKGFGKTEGRLEPIMVGMDKAQKQLERELKEYWEFTPLPVRKQLRTAEWKRSVLKDPTYDLWDVAHNYCLAVEAMLQQRLGRSLDSSLEDAPEEEADNFRQRFLSSKWKRWSADELTISQFQKHLGEAFFRRMLARAGMDSRFIFHELPDRLSEILPYRNPADHVTKERPLEPDRLTKLRDMILAPREGILHRLATMKTPAS